MGKQIKNLSKRNAAEKRFKALGIASIAFSLTFLVILFSFIFIKGNHAFWKSEIALEIDLRGQTPFQQKGSDPFLDLNYRALVKDALRSKFPEAKELAEINSLYQLISKIATVELREKIKKHPEFLGQKKLIFLSASSKADMFLKANLDSALNKQQIAWLTQLKAEKLTKQVFNYQFFRFADSREPEIAGIKASLLGSFFSMLIFLACAFPIAIMCAFYLEEFAPKNKITDIIEISINNLAAIPSIIYGLLGLVIYLQFMNLPRSSSLVGGMTLFMLVLPVIIIATRNTIRSIPQSIRDAAMALGASKIQTTFHHLLPLSIPGIMTGTILAISRALGETAPLLMIGMVAFIADAPKNFFDPTTVLPVQIYLWSDSPEVGFAEKTAAAIIILLVFLVLFNLLAIVLRKRFETRW